MSRKPLDAFRVLFLRLLAIAPDRRCTEPRTRWTQNSRPTPSWRSRTGSWISAPLLKCCLPYYPNTTSRTSTNSSLGKTQRPSSCARYGRSASFLAIAAQNVKYFKFMRLRNSLYRIYPQARTGAGNFDVPL